MLIPRVLVFMAITNRRVITSALFDSHIGRRTTFSRHREKSRMNSCRDSAEKETDVAEA